MPISKTDGLRVSPLVFVAPRCNGPSLGSMREVGDEMMRGAKHDLDLEKI